MERAVANYIDHALATDGLKDPDKTSSGSSILSALETLATRNDFQEKVSWALEDARYDRLDIYQVREMSLEHEAKNGSFASVAWLDLDGVATGAGRQE